MIIYLSFPPRLSIYSLSLLHLPQPIEFIFVYILSSLLSFIHFYRSSLHFFVYFVNDSSPISFIPIYSPSSPSSLFLHPLSALSPRPRPSSSHPSLLDHFRKLTHDFYRLCHFLSILFLLSYLRLRPVSIADFPFPSPPLTSQGSKTEIINFSLPSLCLFPVSIIYIYIPSLPSHSLFFFP